MRTRIKFALFGIIALLFGLALYLTPIASAITVPTNIIAYVPITFFNYNSLAIATNTPLAIGTVNSVSGNVIGVNVFAYNSFYTCNLNNAEFFTSTGTIVPSWLEGNYLNEYQANPTCTDSGSANALVDSANVLYWIESPVGFLGSGGSPSVPITNTIYLGFAGNTATVSNTLFSITNQVGEAPQLSCNSPQTTETGCAGTNSFALYDTGNIVFNGISGETYQAFIGISVPNAYTSAGSGVTIDNGVSIVTGTTTGVNSLLSVQTNTITPTLVEDLVDSITGTGDTDLVTGWAASTNQWVGVGDRATSSTTDYTFFSKTTFSATTQLLGATPIVTRTYWYNTSQDGYAINYGPPTFQTSTVPSTAESVGIYAASTATKQVSMEWIRLRRPTPSNTLPATVFGTTVNTILVANPPTASNQVITTAGQVSLQTSHVSGGLSPYTYQWYTTSGTSTPGCTSSNAISGATQSTYLATVFTTNSYAYQVTDSETPTAQVLCSTGDYVANIIAYVPITFFNYNSVALTSNTPLAVGVQNTVSGNIIGFNALVYKQYYTCNLNNAAFFYANDTLIPSWLEGNYLNEYTANTQCTGTTSTNALVNSANILYWVLIGNNAASFLPAGSPSNPTVNTIYLGWAGNVITTSNTLFSNTITGEAPQLSCNTPQTTATGCISNQYGQWDTGNVVFGTGGVYFNFTGSSAPPGWTNSGGTIANGVKVTASQNLLSALKYGLTTTKLLDDMVSFAGSTTVAMAGYETSASVEVGVGTQTGNSNWQLRSDSTLVPSTTAFSVTPITASIFWPSSTMDSFSVNYGNFITNTGTVPSSTMSIGIISSLTSGTLDLQWQRIRIQPPANVLPATTFGTVVVPVASANQLIATPNPYTFSNTSISIGQLSTGNTVISNGIAGTAVYTANVFWYAPSASNIPNGNTIIASLPTNNALTFTITTDSSNSLEITYNGIETFVNAIGINTIYGTWTFNAYASDTNNDLNPTPRLTNTLIINPALVSNSFSALSPITDFGLSQTLTAGVTGGASAYTYNFLVYNAINSLVTSALYTNVLTVNAFTFQIQSAWGTGNYMANVIITDNELYTAEKVTNTIYFTVNTMLNANPPTPSPVSIDNGQSITLTANPTGGSGGNLFQWYTDSGNDCVSLTIIIGAVSSTYVASPSSSTYYCYIVTDSALGAATSSAPANVIVYTALTANMPSLVPSNIILDSGQTEVFTANWVGGVPPFTFNFFNITGLVSIDTGTGSPPQSNTFITGATGTFKFNVIVKDSSQANQGIETINSIVNTIIVNQQLFANEITPVNPTISSGHPITLTSNAAGGTVPYTINWFAQASCGGGSVATGTTYTPSPVSTTTFSYNVVDSATTNNAVCSGTDTVTVIGAVKSISWTAYNSPIEVGEYQTLNAVLQNGQSPFSYNFLVYNPSNVLTYNLLITSTTAVTENFVFLQGTPNGIWTANIIITDNLGSQATNSLTYLAYNTLIAGAITPSNPTIYPGTFFSNQILLTANVLGGVPPYTYIWYSGQSSACSGDSVVSGATGTTLLVSPTTSTYYCYQVTDSLPLSNSSQTDLVTVKYNCPALLNITTNTIYQSTDPGTFIIYAITMNTVNAFVGNSLSNIVMVNSTIGNSLIPNAITANIPANYYYQFNFTAPTTFSRICNGNNNPNALIPLPNTNNEEMPLGVLFIILSVVCILGFLFLYPTDRERADKDSTYTARPLYLLIFALAFWIFSLPGFYIGSNTSIFYPQITITTSGTNTVYTPFNVVVTGGSTISKSIVNFYTPFWVSILVVYLIIVFYFSIEWNFLNIRRATE